MSVTTDGQRRHGATSNQHVRSVLLAVGFVVVLIVVLRTIGFSESGQAQRRGGQSNILVGTWTVLTFRDAEDSEVLGRRGRVVFGDAWYGAEEPGARNRGPGPAGSGPGMVAELSITPMAPEETRISFDDPVEAIAFEYRLNSGLGGVTAVFFEQSGLVLGSVPLDGSGSAADGANRPGWVEFKAPVRSGIARVEFDGADLVVGHFTLDNLAFLQLDLIFADDFETGTTDNWDVTVGPTATPVPSCDDIIVGQIDWYGINWPAIIIEPVTNTHPTAQLMHKRTDLDWACSHGGYCNQLRNAFFDKSGGALFPYGVYRPPIGRSIDIPFEPGESTPFLVDWDPSWQGTFYPGLIEIRIRFEYPGGGPTCEYVRSILGQYTPTNTFTPTPTQTPTPTKTPTPGSG